VKTPELSDHFNTPFYQKVAQVAENTGMRAYVVGGYVRDLILKRPSKDLDIVVEGSGILFAEALSKELGEVQVHYFKNFGTAMFMHEGLEIEIVGARKESYRSDSRKPIVEDGTLQEDRERRDFTINALSISLNKDDYGALIDPFNGIGDIEKKRLVTPLEPEQTFSDDPLRMMRCIRFSCQLNFMIDDETLKAISTQHERIKIVSQERIVDELNKIIMTQVPSKGFKLLFNTKLLHIIFPKMVELQGVEVRNGVGHKDNFYHTIQVLDNVAVRSENLWLRWAAIMHDIAKPDTKRFDAKHGWTFHGHEDLGAKMTKRIFRSLKLPLDDKMRFVRKMVRLHLRPIALSKKDVSDSGIRRLIFDAGEDLEELMILCESDITSKNEHKVQRFLDNFQLVRKKCVEVEESDRLKNWQPPVGGEEIMNIFGIGPGKEIGIIKTEIREAILEGKIANSHKSALDFVIESGIRLGLTPKQ